MYILQFPSVSIPLDFPWSKQANLVWALSLILIYITQQFSALALQFVKSLTICPNWTPSLSSTGVKLSTGFPKAFQQLLFKERQVAIAVHHLVSAPIAAGKHPLWKFKYGCDETGDFVTAHGNVSLARIGHPAWPFTSSLPMHFWIFNQQLLTQETNPGTKLTI